MSLQDKKGKPIQPGQINQSNTYRKDLIWLYFVKAGQQVTGQQSYIPVSVA